jgi:uncharacterized SAM-binding protein YcdF (DUF218 family)
MIRPGPRRTQRESVQSAPMPVRFWLFGTIVSALALLGCFIGVGLFLNRRRLPAAPADVALVFGTGLHWKAESRWRTAAAVFDRGLAPHLIVSGGVPMPGMRAMSEAEWFRERLLEHGVPDERIHLENRATNTGENIEFTTPILAAHGWTRVILVMSDFEGIRAHLTARRAWGGDGIAIFDCHAASIGHWSAWTWWLSKEGWQLTWYTVPRLFRYRLLPYLWR